MLVGPVSHCRRSSISAEGAGIGSPVERKLLDGIRRDGSVSARIQPGDESRADGLLFPRFVVPRRYLEKLAQGVIPWRTLPGFGQGHQQHALCELVHDLRVPHRIRVIAGGADIELHTLECLLYLWRESLTVLGDPLDPE